MRGKRGRSGSWRYPKAGNAAVRSVLATILVFAVVWPTSAIPQTNGPVGPSIELVSRNVLVMQAQVELGIRLAEQAKTVLETGTSEEGIQKATALTHKSYVFLRFAMHGVDDLQQYGGVSRSRRYILLAALTAINEARQHLLSAELSLGYARSPEGRAHLVVEAERSLGDVGPPAWRALRLLQLVSRRTT